MFCKDGEHSVMSHLFLTTPEGCLKALLHNPYGKDTIISIWTPNMEVMLKIERIHGWLVSSHISFIWGQGWKYAAEILAMFILQLHYLMKCEINKGTFVNLRPLDQYVHADDRVCFA